MKRLYYFLPFLMILLVMIGCSQTSVQLGNRAVASGNYSLAKAHFEQALQKNPNDFVARRGLGQVYFHLKEYSEASRQLELARDIRPDDGLTCLYLGMVKEATGDYSAAAVVYGRHLLRSGRESKLDRRVEGRLLYVHNQELRQQVKQTLQFETALSGDSIPGNTVGVLPFLLSGTGGDPLKPLATGLAAAVWYDLSQISQIKLVERQQMKYILDELALVESGFTTEGSSPRLGRIVQAGHLVNGNLQLTGESSLSFQSGIYNTRDSLYQVAINSQERFAKLVQLQKRTSFAIIDALGITLTPAEQNAITKIPTDNFEAFLAYSRGLDELDDGNYESAHDYFTQAATIDPGFEQAVNLQEESGLLLENGGALEEFEAQIATTFTGEPGMGETPLEDIFDITEPTTDPRSDDDPVVESGSVEIGGSIH